LRLLNSNTYCAKLESSWALTEPVRNHGLKYLFSILTL
jgi:hypothetical protein